MRGGGGGAVTRVTSDKSEGDDEGENDLKPNPMNSYTSHSEYYYYSTIQIIECLIILTRYDDALDNDSENNNNNNNNESENDNYYNCYLHYLYAEASFRAGYYNKAKSYLTLALKLYNNDNNDNNDNDSEGDNNNNGSSNSKKR